MGAFFENGFRVFLLAAALLFLGTDYAAAEPVPVRAAAHEGFGRVVFNWPFPVRYTAKQSGNRVVVRFGRPIEAGYGGVVRSLAKYLRRAEPGADGRSVTFVLKNGYGMRSFDMGSAVVVDLVDRVPETKGAKDSAQPAKAKKAAGTRGSGPRVRVRSGVHDGYTRLVFDWPAKTPYGIERKNGEAVVVFRRPGRIDFAGLKRKPPKFIKGMRAETTGNGVSVFLRVAGNSRLQDFLSGSKVVVDVMAPSGPEVAPRAAAAPRTKKTPKAPKSLKSDIPGVTISKIEKKQGGPIALVPGGGKGAAGKGRGSEEEMKLRVKNIAKIKMTATTDDAGAFSMRFDWQEPIGAAVFRRVGFLWIVFDKPTRPDLKAIKEAGGNIIRSLEQVPSPRATVLRLETIAGINPTLKRDGFTWIFEFKQQPLVATTEIETNPQPTSPVGPRLFMPIPEPGEAIAVQDPNVGDFLVVVPVIPLGYGVVRSYRFPQVNLLPTGQGVVILPRVDDLRVRSLRQGIEISSAGNLEVSALSAEVRAGKKLGLMRPLTRVVNFDQWKRSTIEDFYGQKIALLNAIAKAKGKAREEARIKLVNFYIAHGFGPEALGVLKALTRNNPGIVNSAEFRLYRGAANFFLRRFEQAKKDFNYKSLDNNDEGTFWRAAVRAAEGDLVGAALKLRRTGAVTRSYPTALKLPLGLLIADAAIEIGDVRQAKHYLDALALEDLTPNQKSQLDYSLGKFDKLMGNFDAAVMKWEEVQGGSDRLSRVKASVDRAELLLKEEKITPGEAIEELEKLRFVWRGDDFEFNLLRRLGGLYLEEKDYRDGLRTLKQAVTYFRTNEKAPEVTQEMVDAYEKLYLGDAADDLPPITAIALYDEFKELTPPGKKGNLMVRKLADRLVGVDLLDRAAALLDAQVSYRLKGLEKARVGAQLALVHVIAKEFKDALTALDRTKMARMPKDLIVQRKYLRARALIGVKRGDEALALLKDDKETEAELLRSGIYWRRKDWPRAAKSLRKLSRTFGAKPKKPLDEKQSQYILNLAIALTLSGNERSLNRLRSDYSRAMDAGPYKDVFRLISSPQTLGLIDYKSIAGKIEDVENFQAFLSTYRQRLRKSGQSAVN